MNKTNLIEGKLYAEARIRSSANWFYWIAGLSLINTIILFTGGSLNFIFGLGITQVIDSFAFYLVDQMGNIATYIAVAIDVFIACIFVLIGRFAGRRMKWAFIVGLIFYAIDGAFFLLWSDYLSIAFHVWAVYSIYKGIPAMKQLKEIEYQLEELEKQEEYQNVNHTIQTQDQEEISENQKD